MGDKGYVGKGMITLWVPVTVSHGLICGFVGTGA